MLNETLRFDIERSMEKKNFEFPILLLGRKKILSSLCREVVKFRVSPIENQEYFELFYLKIFIGPGQKMTYQIELREGGEYECQ